MPRFFHFEDSVNDTIIDLTNICQVVKCIDLGCHAIELFGPGGSVIRFKTEEARNASYEDLKRALLVN